jgi:putative ABC transport system permease protein
MLKNFLLVGFRNIRKYFVLSTINILGLALGMASTLLITLFVHHEFTHDTQFECHERIYRISTSFYNLGTFANGPEHLTERLQQFPEVEVTVRIERSNEVLMQSERVNSLEDDVYEVDSTFFNMFNFEFLAGSSSTCLNQNASIVLTESMAFKYFGTTEALGLTLLIGKEKREAIVTGVVMDNNQPTHLKAKIWMPFKSDKPLIGDQNSVNWNSAYTYNYVRLKPGFGRQVLEAKLAQLIKAEVFPTQSEGQSYNDWVASPNAYRLYVQPLTDIYLDSKLKSELSSGGNRTHLFMFVTAACLILALAMVNFINLSMASATSRAKEVGLKKTLGVPGFYLIGQFLTESLLTCIFALGISLIMAESFLVGYQMIMDRLMLPGIFANPQVLIFILGVACLVAIMAGIYPAFYLTSFQAIRVLKGDFSLSGKQGFRSALVIFQFVISLSITAFVIVILKQLTFLQSKDLGFDKENIIAIRHAGALGSRTVAFQNTLKQLPQVASSAFTNLSPAGKSFWIYTYQTSKMTESVTLNTMPCDEHTLETFQIKLLEGRNFNSAVDSTSTVALLNETAVKELMLENPIGASINRKPNVRVIGIVKDFHFKSLHEKIEPLVLVYRPFGDYLTFKLTGNVQSFIKQAEEQWKSFSPDEPIKYTLVEQDFEQHIKKDQDFAKVISFFCALTIIVSCMGLLGLSVFAAEQRTKEIAIRKVLGASVKSILILLNGRFTVHILIAVLISTPLAFYVANQWLSEFAYRISFYWDAFIITAMGIILLVWVTIAVSSWRTMVRNPVDSLRSE